MAAKEPQTDRGLGGMWSRGRLIVRSRGRAYHLAAGRQSVDLGTARNGPKKSLSNT